MFECRFSGRCSYRNARGNCRKGSHCALRIERERMHRGDFVFIRGLAESIGLRKHAHGYVCTSGTLTDEPNASGYAHVCVLSVGEKKCVTVNMLVYQAAVQKSFQEMIR
jgi:hypothetical protein